MSDESALAKIVPRQFGRRARSDAQVRRFRCRATGTGIVELQGEDQSPRVGDVLIELPNARFRTQLAFRDLTTLDVADLTLVVEARWVIRDAVRFVETFCFGRLQQRESGGVVEPPSFGAAVVMASRDQIAATVRNETFAALRQRHNIPPSTWVKAIGDALDVGVALEQLSILVCKSPGGERAAAKAAEEQRLQAELELAERRQHLGDLKTLAQSAPIKARRKTAIPVVSSIAVGIAVLILAVILFPRGRGAAADPLEALCSPDGPAGVTALLLDIPPDLPELAAREIANVVAGVAAEVAPGDRVSVYRLNASEGELPFSACRPGPGSDLSGFGFSSTRAEAAWLTAYTDATAKALAPNTRNAPSPIMYRLQEIGVDDFAGLVQDGRRRHLIVFSDLIEDGPVYSQLSDPLSYDSFRTSPAFVSTRTNLNGAKVDIYYLLSSAGPLDSGDHIQFWSQWVAGAFGVLDSVQRPTGIP